MEREKQKQLEREKEKKDREEYLKHKRLEEEQTTQKDGQPNDTASQMPSKSKFVIFFIFLNLLYLVVGRKYILFAYNYCRIQIATILKVAIRRSKNQLKIRWCENALQFHHPCCELKKKLCKI